MKSTIFSFKLFSHKISSLDISKFIILPLTSTKIVPFSVRKGVLTSSEISPTEDKIFKLSRV